MNSNNILVLTSYPVMYRLQGVIRLFVGYTDSRLAPLSYLNREETF